MSVNAPLGATSEGGSFEVTAAATFARPAHTLPRPRTRTRAELIGICATLAVPLLGLLVCIAATRSSALVPQSLQLAPQASGMAGPFQHLGFSLGLGEVVALLVVLMCAYLTALRYCAHVPARLIVWAVAAFTLIVVLGPPLFSTDVFSYQAYARMFAHYHTNPYLWGPRVIGDDYPLYWYIGARWIGTPSVYGPLFTFLSTVFAATSVAFNYFAFKVIAAAASASTLVLIWRSAQRRGVSPKRGIALFGLNPIVTLCGVGGGHNDLLMLALTSWGVYAVMTRRERAAGTLFSIATGIKLTGGLVLPFALIGDTRATDRSSRRRLLGAALATGAVLAGASYVAFGTGILHMLSTLQSVQDQGSWQSLPGFLFSLTNVSVTPAVRIADDVVLAVALLWLLRRVWRGRMDWIEGAAWATFAVLLTAWSLVPWYCAWLMPLVALTNNTRLWRAATAATVMGGTLMVASCFPWGWL
ncbi:MAG: polyprenol phosphomannose-dependent alpha 1,6 mannosyltransferase MptB [Acidobacteriota bacterium]|nr:polyprenol phosphomannose-dependent alpha 1,6 mannosyltransferase MptB [Acidobacteriota bacterium]